MITVRHGRERDSVESLLFQSLDKQYLPWTSEGENGESLGSAYLLRNTSLGWQFPRISAGGSCSPASFAIDTNDCRCCCHLEHLFLLPDKIHGREACVNLMSSGLATFAMDVRHALNHQSTHHNLCCSTQPSMNARQPGTRRPPLVPGRVLNLRMLS